jgi:hypothetical protein
MEIDIEKATSRNVMEKERLDILVYEDDNLFGKRNMPHKE